MAQIASFTGGHSSHGMALVALHQVSFPLRSMRRVLTFFTAVVLLLMSLGIGLVTADLPFWRRAYDLPLAPGEGYLPVARIGNPPPAAGGDVAVDAAQISLDPARL